MYGHTVHAQLRPFLHSLQVVRQLEKNLKLKLKEKDNAALANTYAHLQVWATTGRTPAAAVLCCLRMAR